MPADLGAGAPWAVSGPPRPRGVARAGLQHAKACTSDSSRGSIAQPA
ncbi:MAG: hypothetical protein LBE67_10995 [Kocuria palustris]|nr:hypothetical protein [Kocuria palustris]